MDRTEGRISAGAGIGRYLYENLLIVTATGSGGNVVLREYCAYRNSAKLPLVDPFTRSLFARCPTAEELS
jgi:hypothetical protein